MKIIGIVSLVFAALLLPACGGGGGGGGGGLGPGGVFSVEEFVTDTTVTFCIYWSGTAFEARCLTSPDAHDFKMRVNGKDYQFTFGQGGLCTSAIPRNKEQNLDWCLHGWLKGKDIPSWDVALGDVCGSIPGDEVEPEPEPEDCPPAPFFHGQWVEWHPSPNPEFVKEAEIIGRLGTVAGVDERPWWDLVFGPQATNPTDWDLWYVRWVRKDLVTDEEVTLIEVEWYGDGEDDYVVWENDGDAVFFDRGGLRIFFDPYLWEPGDWLLCASVQVVCHDEEHEYLIEGIVPVPGGGE